MKPINEVRSVMTPLNRKNVDTDQIISKEFLKRIERTGFGSTFSTIGDSMRTARKTMNLS